MIGVSKKQVINEKFFCNLPKKITVFSMSYNIADSVNAFTSFLMLTASDDLYQFAKFIFSWRRLITNLHLLRSDAYDSFCSWRKTKKNTWEISIRVENLREVKDWDVRRGEPRRLPRWSMAATNQLKSSWSHWFGSDLGEDWVETGDERWNPRKKQRRDREGLRLKLRSANSRNGFGLSPKGLNGL